MWTVHRKHPRRPRQDSRGQYSDGRLSWRDTLQLNSACTRVILADYFIADFMHDPCVREQDDPQPMKSR